MSARKSEYHLAIESSDTTAVSLLAAASGLSKQQLKLAMQKGAVWLTRGNTTQRLRRAKKKLAEGDTLHFYFDSAVQASEPQAALLIADEGDYSVWYKPYGMWSQGSKWGDHCTVYRWAEQHLAPERPAFIVHRLDRAANGLILLAHKKSAAAALAQLFKERSLKKVYRVVAHGHFGDETLTVDAGIDGRPACSHIRRLDYDTSSDRSVLEVNIDSGRKHQIRRHLAGIGFPVVGDRLYGTGDDKEDLQLTAYRLAFRCPVSGDDRDYRLPERLLPIL